MPLGITISTLYGFWILNSMLNDCLSAAALLLISFLLTPYNSPILSKLKPEAVVSPPCCRVKDKDEYRSAISVPIASAKALATEPGWTDVIPAFFFKDSKIELIISDLSFEPYITITSQTLCNR